MIKAKRNRMVIIAILAFCVVLSIILVITFGGKEEEETTKIGFIMSGSIDEKGWNGMHYDGIKKACDELEVELIVKENVLEFSGECNKAIKELVDEGANLIILSSYGYTEEAKDLVKEYPNVVFNGNSSEYHEDNMTSYFVRMYQARYLAGVVAGMKTKTNKIGYVAAMANNEVNRGINAFTLGVKSVNPNAEVIVDWTGNWDDAEAEKKAAEELVKECDADVLTYHQNQANVVEKAEELNVYSIGYHVPVEDCSEKYLTSVVCNWELVYKELVREYLIGKANQKENFWLGMEVGAVQLSSYSDEVTVDIVDAVDNAKNELISGKDVFSRVIYDNEGNLRCSDNETLSDEMLLENLNWYVEGVKFYEK